MKKITIVFLGVVALTGCTSFFATKEDTSSQTSYAPTPVEVETQIEDNTKYLVKNPDIDPETAPYITTHGYVKPDGWKTMYGVEYPFAVDYPEGWNAVGVSCSCSAGSGMFIEASGFRITFRVDSRNESGKVRTKPVEKRIPFLTDNDTNIEKYGVAFNFFSHAGTSTARGTEKYPFGDSLFPELSEMPESERRPNFIWVTIKEPTPENIALVKKIISSVRYYE